MYLALTRQIIVVYYIVYGYYWLVAMTTGVGVSGYTFFYKSICSCLTISSLESAYFPPLRYIESSIYRVAFYRSNRYNNNIFPPTAGGIGGDWLCLRISPRQDRFYFFKYLLCRFWVAPPKNSCSRFRITTQQLNILFTVYTHHHLPSLENLRILIIMNI